MKTKIGKRHGTRRFENRKLSSRELTNEIWARLKKRVIKENPDRMHVMEWDCTGNDHSGDCWCITETYNLAIKLGYNKV